MKKLYIYYFDSILQLANSLTNFRKYIFIFMKLYSCSVLIAVNLVSSFENHKLCFIETKETKFDLKHCALV